MEFSYLLPTDIRFGRGMIKSQPEALVLGKRAYIVTGANSGRASGALADVTEALEQQDVAYSVFEGIGNNPNVRQCKQLGMEARAFGADFIIGIGGGSPLDAAKAIAVFACNDIDEQRLFQYGYDHGILPIAAIPTTSGTGSEVTPWSIMTDDSCEMKRSFGGPDTFPRVAMLDPSYTESLSYEPTLYTAMDAFQHCFESVISTKANPITDAFAFEGLRRFGNCMDQLIAGEHDAIREELMLVSMLGGAAIARAGTTLMHAAGYPYTYYHGLPHGCANTTVMPAYLRTLRVHRAERLQTALHALGKKYEEVTAFLNKNFPPKVQLTEEEMRLFAKQTAGRNPMMTTGVPGDEQTMYEFYRSLQ